MGRYLSVFFLATALLAPITVRADDHDRDDHERDRRVNRYYDTDGRDWHQWNDREDRAYRHYLEERREHYRDWEHVNKRQQRDYWRWRHQHPDNALYPDERR